jgi:pilus assembly protein Flp/PilA
MRCSVFQYLPAGLAGLARDDEGQGLAEYGLIIGIIAIGCIIALIALSGGLNGLLDWVGGFFGG